MRISMGRRSFLKKATVAVAVGAVSPTLLMGKDSKSKKTSAKNGKYPSLEFDVIVVGAGTGGIPAAIRAAQAGAKVALVEEDMQVGGAPVDMFVPTLFGRPKVGLALDLEEELLRDHGLYNWDSGTDPVGWRFFLPAAYLQLLSRNIRAEKNITLFTGTPAIGVWAEHKGNRDVVKGIRIFRNGEIQDLYAKVTIDATGTGVVAAMAGCEYMYGSEAKSDFNEPYGFDTANNKVQLCTQMFISQRIKKDAIFPIGFKGSAAEDGYIGANRLGKEELERRATGIFFHWGQSVEVEDTTDPIQVSEAQRNCLEMYKDRFAQLHAAGFGIHIAPRLGVRECRRIKGEYVLTASNVLEGLFPDDTVAHAQYYLDCWGMELPKGVPEKLYGIPYRSLVPTNTDGLLTAGRVISGTRLAHSSYRVQRCCSNIGEAAGTAAAMASLASTGVRDIEPPKLIAQLETNGLFSAREK
ncbi:MAG: FAD-dependent oxidoreductase [Prevotellaceae bacterium]|nr:FAD-dependent oxidoreductase [Prevotellaceae bacterium]